MTTRVTNASTQATHAILSPILVHPRTTAVPRPIDQFSSATVKKAKAPVHPASLLPSDTTANNVGWVKKSGAAAGAVAAGFPAIVSGQSVTNALKVGLIGAGGRGSGAAAQPVPVTAPVLDAARPVIEWHIDGCKERSRALESANR